MSKQTKSNIIYNICIKDKASKALIKTNHNLKEVARLLKLNTVLLKKVLKGSIKIVQ